MGSAKSRDKRIQAGSYGVHENCTVMSLTYAVEKQVAISAVLRACSLTSSVFNKLVRDETVTKDDKSPVTGPCTTKPFSSSKFIRAFE